ncbi:MAG TPA: hypothetical protein VJJ83_02110 [Candidatus Babeliales bacterium]|nr:hypothetical protein [Candidatus Babeliales bacterium]
MLKLTPSLYLTISRSRLNQLLGLAIFAYMAWGFSTILSNDPTTAEAGDLTTEISAQVQEFLGNYQPDMSEADIQAQLEVDLEKVRYALEELQKTLEIHSEKLIDNDPAMKATYANLAHLLRAHLLAFTGKIENRHQALIVAQTLNTLTGKARDLMASGDHDGEWLMRLRALKQELTKHSQDLNLELRSAKTRGDQPATQQLQAELQQIDQALADITLVNKPVEFIDWVQTSHYNPAARMIRWLTGIQHVTKKAKKN